MLINESGKFFPLQILASQSVVIVSIAWASPRSRLENPDSNFDRSPGNL